MNVAVSHQPSAVSYDLGAPIVGADLRVRPIDRQVDDQGERVHCSQKSVLRISSRGAEVPALSQISPLKEAIYHYALSACFSRLIGVSAGTSAPRDTSAQPNFSYPTHNQGLTH